MVPPRIGTLYRYEILCRFDRLSNPGRVLDVGCHDGYILNASKTVHKFGVDLGRPDRKVDFGYVIADGERLPFKGGAFDQVFALDVLEHVQQPPQFVDSLVRVLAPNGSLFLTTPSVDIHMMPHFLTGWISRKWGHTLRLGFSTAELMQLFHARTRVIPWNAPAWRFFYLPLSLVYRLLPALGAAMVHWIALWDFRHAQGSHGYFFCEYVNSPLTGTAEDR